LIPLPLYFFSFANHFKRTMTRRFLNSFVLSLTFFLAGQDLLRADATNSALAKSDVLENDVAYLRIGHVEKNLADEIGAAQTMLATNKIAGTILDLRFADGDDLDSEKAVENLFASQKLPLAVLVNGKTHGAAIELAEDLRAAKAGLIFGSSTEVKPDISIPANAGDEKKVLENPFGTLDQGETNSSAGTNDFSQFIDHTSEADLVRAKIKDGEQDENTTPERAAVPQKPFIRDPVLARAVDLIKGLAVIRQSHL
jgi:hypothetical protein